MGRRKVSRMANFEAPTLTISEQVEYLNELLEQTLENIDESDEITDEEAEELAEEAIADYEDRLDELEDAYEQGLIPDDEDEDDEDDYVDDAVYSDGNDLATFAAAVDSPVAAAVLMLGSEAGYDDVEELAYDLAESLGLDEDEVAGLLAGEYVPDEEMADAIAEAFELDEEDYEDWMDIAGEQADIALAAEEGEIDEDDLQYSRYIGQQQRQIEELQNQLAEFQSVGEISTTLLELERDARIGVDEGWLPPIAFQTIMGNFERHEDRVASFSQVCASNGVSEDVELYATQKALEVFRQLGPIWANFGAMVEEPLTQREVQNQQAVLTQAQRNHQMRKQRGGLRNTSANITHAEGVNE